MDRVNKGDGIRCVMVSVRDLGLLRDGGHTCSLDMKAVEGSPRICNVIDPLTRADVTLQILGGLGGVHPTFSGSETIIWQSMKIPGTPFETLARTGAPGETG